MLLRELVEDTGLGLRVVHGSDAALDQPVRWVYTTDLLDPRRYLSCGELVLSGLMWRRAAEDSEAFVRAVADAGGVALAAGDALFHGVPGDLVEACRRHGLVLLGVPEDVSFAALTEHVIGHASAEREARLTATVTRQRELLSALAEGRRLDELVAQVARETDRTCRVLSVTGGHVVEGSSPVPAAEVGDITRAFLTAERLPVAVDVGRMGYSLFAVGSAQSQRMTSWTLLVEGSWTSWPAEVVDAISQLGEVIAFDRARRDEAFEVSRAIADDAVGLIDRGAGAQPETTVRLQQAGLSASGHLAVAVAGFTGRPDRVEVARAVLDDAAQHVGLPVVGTIGDERLGQGQVAVAVVPVSDAGFTEVLRTALHRIGPAIGRAPLAVGVSEPSEPPLLSGAMEQARHAYRVAELRHDPVSVVTGSEITSHVLLLAAVPDDIRRTFATRVLGPLRDYDAAHGGELLPTLETFLECSGSWDRTARALQVHVNTVRYRISRVEKLIARDLSRLEDRVDVFLAMRSS